MPSYRLRLVGPTHQLFPNGCPVPLQVSRQLVHGHPVDARAPIVGLHSLPTAGFRFNAFIKFSRSTTSSINCQLPAGLSASLSTTGVTVPSCPSKQASLAPANQKASWFWFSAVSHS